MRYLISGKPFIPLCALCHEEAYNPKEIGLDLVCEHCAEMMELQSNEDECDE